MTPPFSITAEQLQTLKDTLKEYVELRDSFDYCHETENIKAANDILKSLTPCKDAGFGCVQSMCRMSIDLSGLVEALEKINSYKWKLAHADDIGFINDTVHEALAAHAKAQTGGER